MNKGTSFHDNSRDFKSCMLFVGGERCPVAVFKSFVERRPVLKHPCNGLLLSTSKANETENLNNWFKLTPWGKNIITNVMKLSVAGTGLKESEKKRL